MNSCLPEANRTPRGRDQLQADRIRRMIRPELMLKTSIKLSAVVSSLKSVSARGADMSRSPSAAHLAACAGLAPAIHESAGKRTPAGAGHGNKWLNHMLVESAGSVGRRDGKTTPRWS